MLIRLIVGLLITLPLTAMAQPFQSGVTAFQQGDYHTALTHFKNAEASGKQSPQLTYNIASTYYKLGQYKDAEKYYRQLFDDPDWRELALYNTGLIAERQNNASLAQHYYLMVLLSEGNPAVQHLAERKLNNTDDPGSPPNFLSAVSVQAGFDDNAIAFADELQASASAVSDSFVDVYLLGQHGVGKLFNGDTEVQGFFYSKAYQDFSSLNVSVIGANVLQDVNDSDLDRGISLISSLVDNDIAYHQLQLSFTKPFPIFDDRWYIRYYPSYFIGGNSYDQLDGWQQRLSGSRYWLQDSATVQLTLSAELNNRDDLALGSSRYSYSPTRLSVDASWRWYRSARLTYQIGGALTLSRYSGKNRLEDLDGEIKHQQRRGTKLFLTAEVSYLLDRHWTLFGKLEHTDNEENFDYYSYDRNQFSLGADYSF